MKHITFAIAVLAFGTVSMQATAQQARPVAREVIVNHAYNWTGFYTGVNVGYSWGRSSTTHTFTDTASGAVLNGSNSNFNMNGAIGGGQIGYNWQADRWVFGVEADIQASGQKGNATSICGGGTLAALSTSCAPGHIGDTRPFDVPAFPVVSNLSQKLEWFGTVRGRIGPTISPTIFPYVTGGLAYGEISTTNAVSGTNITGTNGTNTFVLTPVAGSAGFRTTRVGWTAGAGLEGVVTGNWTAKVEYIYIDLGHVSGSQITPIVAPSGAFVTSRYDSHITDNILRLGLNYKWGG